MGVTDRQGNCWIRGYCELSQCVWTEWDKTTWTLDHTCVAEGAVCGGPGQDTQTCCGESKCQQLFGGSEMKCAPSPPTCVAEGEVCGGPGQQTQPCCGESQCQQLYGGSEMQCAPLQHTCANVGEVCGGAFQLTQTCCGESTCQQVFGSEFKCAPPPRTLRGSVASARPTS